MAYPKRATLMGVTSAFGWLDTDRSQRQQMLELVDQFREQGTVDDLGIGQIRDASGIFCSPAAPRCTHDYATHCSCPGSCSGRPARAARARWPRSCAAWNFASSTPSERATPAKGSSAVLLVVT